MGLDRCDLLNRPHDYHRHSRPYKRSARLLSRPMIRNMAGAYARPGSSVDKLKTIHTTHLCVHLRSHPRPSPVPAGAALLPPLRGPQALGAGVGQLLPLLDGRERAGAYSLFCLNLPCRVVYV